MTFYTGTSGSATSSTTSMEQQQFTGWPAQRYWMPDEMAEMQGRSVNMIILDDPEQDEDEIVLKVQEEVKLTDDLFI